MCLFGEITRGEHSGGMLNFLWPQSLRNDKKFAVLLPKYEVVVLPACWLAGAYGECQTKSFNYA